MTNLFYFHIGQHFQLFSIHHHITFSSSYRCYFKMSIVMYLYIKQSNNPIKTQINNIIHQRQLLLFQISQYICIYVDQDVSPREFVFPVVIVDTIFLLIFTKYKYLIYTNQYPVFSFHLPVIQATPFSAGFRKTHMSGWTCRGELVWNCRYMNLFR